MKIFALISALFAGIIITPLTTHAQTFDGQQVEQIIVRLKLTDAQREAAAPVILKGFQERLEILKSAGIKRGTKPTFRQLRKVRSPIKKSRTKTEKQLTQIFDNTQMAEYRRIQEELRDKLRSKFK